MQKYRSDCVHDVLITYVCLLLEWVEFSPFEYGIAKYGVFGKTREFGGKFYKGRLVKKFEEPPLHYLQGMLFKSV